MPGKLQTDCIRVFLANPYCDICVLFLITHAVYIILHPTELSLHSCIQTVVHLYRVVKMLYIAHAGLSLQNLSLSHCRLITDAVLAELSGMLRLRYLNLEGCARVTDDGLATLRQAAPPPPPPPKYQLSKPRLHADGVY